MLMASNPVPEPKTILVVDDDLSVLGVIKCMLECGDYNVLMAHSAETALRMTERSDLTIDLMLIDVIMPDISGPDLAERILAVRPHLKGLFMSGCTDSEVVRVKILDRALGFCPSRLLRMGCSSGCKRCSSRWCIARSQARACPGTKRSP
jgi:DNA-binding NtrC family response regulator